MTKIVFIGAGSAVFAHRIITDVLAIDGLNAGEFALIDIDAERLQGAHQLAEQTVLRSGKKFTVQSSTERTELLPNADFVINTIEVAGRDHVDSDYDIPMKYGVDQCIGDTIGPGGVMKFLRTGPAWLAILKDIERLAPNALVLNYTNPMSALVLLGTRGSTCNIVGLCHSVQNTLHELAEYMNVPKEEIEYKVGGINHLAWFTELRHDGQDLFPALRKALNTPEIYEKDIVRFEMFRQFGYFPTESSGHFSEYVPYFRKRPDLRRQYTRLGYKGETGFYAHNWPEWRRNHDRDVAEMISGTKPIDLQRSEEFASHIIEGRLMNLPQRIYGNVPNRIPGGGLLIDNLDPEGVVEVECRVDAAGLNPQPFGKLPQGVAAIDRSHMAVHSLLADAILHEDRELAIQALMLDPLTAAVCSPAEIREMFEELAAVQHAAMPAFIQQSQRELQLA